MAGKKPLPMPKFKGDNPKDSPKKEAAEKKAGKRT